MNSYEKRISVVAGLLLISAAIAQNIMNYPLTPLAYLAVVYNLVVFSVVHRFIQNDGGDPKKSIRRVMIGSMIRLFLMVIFLGISLFNLGKVDLGFILVFISSFLFFLFFEMSKMYSKLRPDSEQAKK
jgi:hypothetical protein